MCFTMYPVFLTPSLLLLNVQIASLCLCNCLCLCTFFLCFSALYQPQCVCVYPFTCCTYILYVNFFCACVIASVCVPVFVPSTTLHVFVYTPSQMVALWCPVNTRALDDCRFSFPLGTSVGLADDRILSLLWPAVTHALVRSMSRPCFRRTFFTRSSIGR